MQEQQDAPGSHGGQDQQGEMHAAGQHDGFLQQQRRDHPHPDIGLSEQLELKTLISLLVERRLKPEDFEARAVPILDKEQMVGILDVSKIFYHYGDQGVQPGEEMKQALGRQAMYNMHRFDPHVIADTIWGCAMMKWLPGQDVLDGMEDRACELAKNFDPREISSTLWAHATLGTSPGHEMMRLLEMQAVSRAEDFEEQQVTNLLWAYASLRWRPGEVLMKKLEMSKGEQQPEEADKTGTPQESHEEVLILPASDPCHGPSPHAAEAVPLLPLFRVHHHLVASAQGSTLPSLCIPLQNSLEKNHLSFSPFLLACSR